MPIMLREYLEQAFERNRQEAGNRPECHVCKEPIIAEGEMDGEVQYVMVDGQRVPVHEDCRYADVESVGRGSPHGGCHGD